MSVTSPIITGCIKAVVLPIPDDVIVTGGGVITS